MRVVVCAEMAKHKSPWTIKFISFATYALRSCVWNQKDHKFNIFWQSSNNDVYIATNTDDASWWRCHWMWTRTCCARINFTRCIAMCGYRQCTGTCTPCRSNGALKRLNLIIIQLNSGKSRASEKPCEYIYADAMAQRCTKIPALRLFISCTAAVLIRSCKKMKMAWGWNKQDNEIKFLLCWLRCSLFFFTTQ